MFASWPAMTQSDGRVTLSAEWYKPTNRSVDAALTAALKFLASLS